jgi:hypothetical protein
MVLRQRPQYGRRRCAQQVHNKPIDHPDVMLQRQEILMSIRLEEEEMNRFRITSLIWDTTDLRAGRRIRIAFCLLAIQQMMGEIPSEPIQD